MQLPTLQSAKLIRRYKRFLTDIELPNGEVSRFIVQILVQ